ncbi:unnamed protein product [Mytilus edulis]|uniref:Uncharacterized protein n=1 Tax=Mytilus edulis TaxID=6550 RepID=A0A8S3U7U4_MYTED|nr:unnamed protein product [Mytilus edulis]
MKTTYLRYSWQLLTVLLFQTGFVHLITIRNDPTTKQTSAMLHGDKRQHPFRTYTLGIKNTISPPVFVEKIENKQYGNLGEIFKLKFVLYTKSEIIWYNVKSENQDIAASMEKTSVNGTIIFHGTKITVESIQVVLSFNISNNNYSQIYTVTLCNGFGNNSFEVGIEIVTIGEKNTHGTNVAIIISLVILVMCFPISGAAAFFISSDANQRSGFYHFEYGEMNVRIVDIVCLDTINNVVGFPVPVPVNHVQNNHAHSRDPLTNNAVAVIQTCTSETGRINDAKSRTVYTDENDSAKAVHFIASRHVISSDETGYSDAWTAYICGEHRRQTVWSARKDFNLEFIVYTQSMINCYNVKSANKDITTSMEMTSVNGTTIFHGTEITVEAIQVVLSFKISNNNYSHMHTVTLCNGFGNNSFQVEIELVTTGQPVPVENIVYQDAISFRPRPLQASGEVIEYNYETYSHDQNMRPLTGQLNYSDVYFQPSMSQDVRIRGIENRTVYSEVLNFERSSSVIDTQSVSSSDKEDIDIEGLENFIDRSED